MCVMKTFSIKKPIKAISISINGIATINERPRAVELVRDIIEREPIIIISPWAKFTASVAL